MRSRICFALLPLALAFILTGAPVARADIRLYLKDGSYQLVQSYETQGDRVRYYSVERSGWEEIPRDLVDFEATERAQKEEPSSHKEEREEARTLDRERFEKPESQGFEIVPGVRLPGDEGVFAYDGMRVIRMMQSSAEVVKDKKRAALVLALPGPLLKSRAFVILPGARAPVRVMSTEPVFYVQSADGLGAKIELITVKPRKESRQVEKVEWRGGLTKPAELRAAVPMQRTEIAPGLFKLIPTKPLDPGEYALGELIQAKLNLELWDFGVEGAPSHIVRDTEEPPKIRRTDEKPPED
jgi:hypothetical protein